MVEIGLRLRATVAAAAAAAVPEVGFKSMHSMYLILYSIYLILKVPLRDAEENFD